MVWRQSANSTRNFEAMLILIWSSQHQDLSICLLNGHGYGLYYHGARVSAVGTFEYAKRLAEAEYVLNNERVFYADPAAGFDHEQ